MNLKTLFLTQNNCYKSGKRHTPKGIMVHSTGANNPWLKRYVGPDDGLLGSNPYNNHWNQPTPGGRSVCVHAFIGKLKDGSIATYQTLPWDMVGWHSGSGSLGSAKNANNNGYIGFEICEDDLTDPVYFNQVYQEAVELCAYLCKMFNIKPEKPWLICHSEGHQLGIASNHSDVMHWFPRHGKSMDTFRADVAKKLAEGSVGQDAGHPIIGKATTTAAQAKEWARKNGATELFISLAETFWKIAQAAGVNPVVAYAQSAKETGYGHFKGVLNESFRNPCGLKTKTGGSDNDPNAHQRFNSWEEGIQAQVDHLALYAGAPGYPKTGTPDPRHFPYIKGTAPNVEDLGGKWAPSATYGKDIVAMMAKLEATAAPAAPAPQPQPGVMYYVQTGAYSNKANADAQYYKVKAAGFDAIIKKTGNLYRVQVGAFSKKANADAFAAKVKAAGFDTYVTTTGGTQVAPGPAPKATETKTIKVGSKVKVKNGAKTYTGGSLASFVYNTVYDVLQINGNRVVIGLKGQVTAAIRLEDLILQ
jgi:hypothetical protein